MPDPRRLPAALAAAALAACLASAPALAVHKEDDSKRPGGWKSDPAGQEQTDFKASGEPGKPDGGDKQGGKDWKLRKDGDGDGAQAGTGNGTAGEPAPVAADPKADGGSEQPPDKRKRSAPAPAEPPKPKAEPAPGDSGKRSDQPAESARTRSSGGGGQASATPPAAPPAPSAVPAPIAPVVASPGSVQPLTRSPGGGQAPRSPSRSARDGRRGGEGGSAIPGPLTAGPVAPLFFSGALSSADSPPAPLRETDAKDSGPRAQLAATVREIVEVVPRGIWWALAGLAVLAALLGAGAAAATVRSRRLDRQRAGLLEEVGLLQAALLPTIPPRLGPLDISVAYRPAQGLAAGGDFYDAFEFDDGRIAILIGDVSGHGREALTRTALIRYSLRAYLEAGLSPRLALQLAGRALATDLGEDFATVVTAVYNPRTAELTYASAGHPAPVIVVEGDPTGAADHLPAGGPASYPIGIGLLTGLRQTTVPLRPGMTACLYTDGLIEARRNGRFFGRRGIAVMAGDRSATRAMPGRVGAADVIDAASEWAGGLADDVAVCLLRPLPGTGPGASGERRVEEFEVGPEDVARGDVEAFLAACDVPAEEAGRIAGRAAEQTGRGGRLLVRVEKRPGSHDVELVTPDVVNIPVEVADPGRAAGLLSRSA